jgi:hypothetical protein
LETRTLFSTLLVVPPPVLSGVDAGPAGVIQLPLAPNVGLKNAQVHTGGIVTWNPEAEG